MLNQEKKALCKAGDGRELLMVKIEVTSKRFILGLVKEIFARLEVAESGPE